MNPQFQDELLIRQMVERWAVWRDAGHWDRFATVWHPDGVMMATWFQGPARGVIEASQEGFDRGVHILHTRSGWQPALNAGEDGDGRIMLDELVEWHARMDFVSQFG